jgi:GT2 family glycosyltransferase
VGKKKATGAGARQGAHGLVNKVEGARVLGWAHDPSADDSQTVVEFLLDGQVIESKIATLQRLPLIDKGFPPNCGFSVNLPLPPGTHTVSARTKATAFELKNSPFTCTVSPPKGIPPTETAISAGVPDANPAKMGLTASSAGAVGANRAKTALREVDVQAERSRASVTLVEDSHPARLIVGSSNIETVVLSSSGAILILGWAIAHSVAIKKISITTPAGACIFAGAELGRSRRKDVEKAVSGAPGHKHLGIFGLGQAQAPGTRVSDSGNLCTATIEFENGLSRSQKLEARCFDDAAFIEAALNAFSALEYYGNSVVESFAILDSGLGDRFIELQTAHVNRVARARSCERFGTANRTPKATIVVCLYGRPEYQFLQNALFGLGPAAAEYEFIYVCNSPELIDGLHKTAAISQRIYGLSQTIVALPANAGFGTANNVAANYAGSDRLLFVNPDVFPRGDSWGNAHQAIVETRPKHQTKLFGARLFYSDGSLMHAGMHVDADTGVSIRDQSIEGRPLLRVEHFGKGAPPDLAAYRGTRPVPAVSGALMSIDRGWFESLNGFAGDYVFGHYEDADLCLRSFEKNVVPYVHDLEFWHLEGKGSTRLPCHDAASTINRWHFTRTWHDKVMGGFPMQLQPSSGATRSTDVS